MLKCCENRTCCEIQTFYWNPNLYENQTFDELFCSRKNGLRKSDILRTPMVREKRKLYEIRKRYQNQKGCENWWPKSETLRKSDFL